MSRRSRSPLADAKLPMSETDVALAHQIGIALSTSGVRPQADDALKLCAAAGVDVVQHLKRMGWEFIDHGLPRSHSIP